MYLNHNLSKCWSVLKCSWTKMQLWNNLVPKPTFFNTLKAVHTKNSKLISYQKHTWGNFFKMQNTHPHVCFLTYSMWNVHWVALKECHFPPLGQMKVQMICFTLVLYVSQQFWLEMFVEWRYNSNAPWRFEILLLLNQPDSMNKNECDVKMQSQALWI